MGAEIQISNNMTTRIFLHLVETGRKTCVNSHLAHRLSIFFSFCTSSWPKRAALQWHVPLQRSPPGLYKYFFVERGFGCYQVLAVQYQTHVWLVNRQLAGLQAPHSVQRGRAEPRGAVTLIPPLSLPNSPH